MVHTAFKKRDEGFTLIELLIVIGIIGFLAAAVLVAVDPVKRIQDARDARRFSEANALLNAVLTKQVDDRRIYNGPSDAPLITSSTKAQVIVTSSTGVECDTATAALTTENFPGCGQSLDNAARAVAGTVSSSAAVVTGTSTTFTTTLRVGDTIYDAATNGLSPCVVLSIASDTSLTCTASVAPAYATSTVVAKSKNCVVNLSDTFTGLGTATSSGTTVSGAVGTTNFSVQVSVGDTLTSAAGSTCVVASITDLDTLVCTVAPNPVFAGTYTITLSNALVPNYIASAPLDPRGSGQTICQTGCTTNGVGITTVGTTNTGYYLHRTTGNRIEVGACSGEQTTTINVKR